MRYTYPSHYYYYIIFIEFNHDLYDSVSLVGHAPS